MASFGWESGIVDPFLSLDNSTLIPILQDAYPPQSNPKPKDSLDSTTSNGAATNSVSPPYSDSSPSPSSANEESPLALNDSRPNGDASHKRKTSYDDDIEVDEQQSASRSFTTQDGKVKRTVAPSRRKSGGERIHDESKLLKRKEQNRAAQRAFRERKEKHVKDLEDRVAQLEAKSDTQTVENENLREMLKRLQAENSMLRQSSFSFSLPTNSGMPNASSSTTFSLPEPGPSRSRPDTTSNAPTQINGSSQPSFNSQYSNFDSSTTSAALADNSTNMADVDFDLFGGPFTTVASNPMFMSYRDPAESMNAFASFGGWDDMSLINTFDQLNGLSSLNSGDITASQKNTSPVMPYDAQFQAALTKKHVTQEPCMIDQLCIDMQRKATCTALQ